MSINSNKSDQYILLNDKFINKYKELNSPFAPLGEFVYYRTYSRWLPDNNRRERWYETIRRAVEFNTTIVKGVSKEEAQKLYDNVFNLKQFLSGRTMWVGLTEVSKEYPMANYNCALTVIDDFIKFKELFYLLMIGTGVGFRVLKSDVDKLVPIRTNFKLLHDEYIPIAKNDREDNTSIIFKNNTATMYIGDSKEGWTQSLDLFLKLLYEKDYKNIDTIKINYNNIRGYGEKLKRFGGTASGHESIKIMFEKITKVLNSISNNELFTKLEPIHCIDIANIIGENVVIGGVRRTAEIGLVDSSDKKAIEAKNGLYSQNENGEWFEDESISHRRMSNNSIYYEIKPSREQLHWQLNQMRYSGEPGFINAKAAKNRRPDFAGTNPCFAGDMKLLTIDGYKTFEELNNTTPIIINENGDSSISKIWCSGEKETIELKFSNNTKIKCTPDHVFKLATGEECQAKDLKGKRVLSYKEKSSLVISIKSIGIQKVYDFSEPLTNWGVVEGFIVHNCGEILLRDRGLCNLTTVNVMGFVIDGQLDIDGLLEAQRLSARAGLRMTCLELELDKWNNTQKEDRLLGCSLTGFQDAMNALSFTKTQQEELLRKLHYEANKEANTYALELNINPPMLVCTVKPEGSLSQLPIVSSGVHFSHSPYYIRRVRINSKDPLVKVCEELNYPIFPEVGQDIETCTTKVIEFPIKAPKGKTKYDVSAIEQLEIYSMFQENYTDHNSSITIHVRNHEWEEVEEWVFQNWNSIVAVSFLSLDDSFYKLLPYEAIEEEEYLRRVNSMKPFSAELLLKYETVEVDLDIGTSGCESGICPIR